MRKFLSFGVSILAGAAIAVCLWLLTLTLGPHHFLVKKMAGGATLFFEWDMIAVLSVSYAIYLTIAFLSPITPAIRMRFHVAFVVAILCCLPLSFEKIYIDDFMIVPSSSLHITNAH
jgi:hypothetical protein